MKKPCRLEINNTGAWKLIGRFDADLDWMRGYDLDGYNRYVKLARIVERRVRGEG